MFFTDFLRHRLHEIFKKRLPQSAPIGHLPGPPGGGAPTKIRRLKVKANQCGSTSASGTPRRPRPRKDDIDDRRGKAWETGCVIKKHIECLLLRDIVGFPKIGKPPQFSSIYSSDFPSSSELGDTPLMEPLRFIIGWIDFKREICRKRETVD